ncbi:hypothetical protein I9054_006910 [Acinetobacter bereziniae]|uniref:Uncharacterized protein n=1 Tax=Acinetobacter bereziniae TaxID=106648 RepID=A0A8I1ADW8_ACIBZ|nr:hypothetical protein [Acinetobacter bereziniae]UUN99173.1 hypothetical protein I9054_006910 [Acinetobacter bereziniae]
MTNLISGKEALIALANGEDLQWRDGDFRQWNDVNDELRLGIFNDCEFRLKPRTITINGIEVPAPFDPKEGEEYWCFSTQTIFGYGHNVYVSERADRRFINMGAWRTEEEIKQVVAALRQIFGGV